MTNPKTCTCGPDDCNPFLESIGKLTKERDGIALRLWALEEEILTAFDNPESPLFESVSTLLTIYHRIRKERGL